MAFARELVERGADVNERDWLGRTPFEEASRRGFRDIMQLLLVHRVVWVIQKDEARTLAGGIPHLNVLSASEVSSSLPLPSAGRGRQVVDSMTLN